MRRALIGTIAAFAASLSLAAPAGAYELWAVGDGADSGSNDDALATALALRAPDRLLYLGDVYGDATAGVGDGSAAAFSNYYNPGFGRLKATTSPTPGNHETPTSAGYDPYWGAQAPTTNGGHYYSFDAGGWHLVSLDSEEPIGSGSAQLAWLQSDLAAHAGTCTIAFDHKPRFTDGLFAGKYETTLAPLWATLKGHAVALLSGPDHNYQRFKPVDDITQFVVGTGGHGFHAISPTAALAAWTDNHYGALHLSLGAGQAAFEFVATDGTQLDSGGLTCSAPTTSTPPPAPTDPPPPSGDPSQPPPGDGTQPAAPGSPATQPGSAPAAGDDDPLVLVASPRSNHTYSRVRLLRGIARNVKGPVQLVLRRGNGRACRAYGVRGFRYSCRRPSRLTARGVAAWSRRLRAGALRRGTYRLTARAGNASDIAVFRIR